jgi:hypothetical protein
LASFAEAIVADKDAFAAYLATTDGLRETDDPSVTVSSAADDELPSTDMVILGDVTIPQTSAGLYARAGNPTMSGWVMVVRPEGGEAAKRTVRAVAGRLMGRVEGAVAAINRDPARAGISAMPGSVQVTTSGLQEAPSRWNDQASRQAQISFSITWMRSS